MAESRSDREIQLVEAALEQPVELRSAFLDRACADDPELVARVRDLLQRVERGEGARELFDVLLPTLKSKTVPDASIRDADFEEIHSVGKYTLERELGRGGQGVVFSAIDETLGRRVALKILHPSAALEPTTRKRFMREAGVAARLEHPGICVVYEAGVEQGIDYIAMRFVEGQTLATRIPERAAARRAGQASNSTASVEFRRVALIIEKVARALQLAHEAGIVHRDIKSQNIIVTPEEEPVILDFGLARDQTPGDTLTLSNQLLGTPAFMSPEQVSGSPSALDRQTDVWSLGVVLYQSLTLELPFDGPTIHDILRRIQDRDPTPIRRRNPSIPHDLEVIVATALEKDRNRRYRSALALADDLRRFQNDEVILARPAGVVQRAIRFARRHPMRALAMALGILVLALSLGAAWLTRSLDQKARELLGHNDLSIANGLESIERTVLWPVREAAVPRFDEWLSRYAELAAQRPERQRSLEELRRRRDSNGEWNDAFDYAIGRVLEEHIRTLDRLDALAPSVKERRERAASLRERTIDRYRKEWSDCARAIASSSAYGGMTIEPQCGLVPLGFNEEGYFEFWHVESGTRPDSGASGRFEMNESSGMILVLLPGGTPWIGACPRDLPQIDPQAQISETPMQVRLGPFFISKFEMTQGQWLHLFGENPSTWKPGTNDWGWTRDLTYPVETVDWNLASEAMRRLDLLLPSDAQWEYACRAGTESIWSTGDSSIEIGTFANLRGEESNGHFEGLPTSKGYRDPFIRTAPVGLFPANGFGIHDMHGNVYEWCRDRYVRSVERLNPTAGEGVREPVEDTGQRCVRGGDCTASPRQARSAARAGESVGAASYVIGLRAARALVRSITQ